MTIQEMNELTELLDVMTPDVEAIQEVVKAHEILDPKNEPLVLSMSLLNLFMDYNNRPLGDSIWGTEYVG